MSRVQCIDCGVPVVVDPSGLCPDGHFVGTDGARIEAAIGVAVPHPDEPEPWVAHVDVDPRADAGTAPGAAARAARPPSAPDEAATQPGPAASLPTGSGPPPTTADNGQLSAMDTDDLLRELHSLSDGPDDVPSPPHVQPTPRPAAATPPASSPATPHRAPPPETSAESSPAASPAPDELPPPEATAEGALAHHDGLAELRALEAAVNALTSGEDPDSLAEFADPTVAAPTAAPVDEDGVVTRLPAPTEGSQDTPDRDKLAEVEELFARRPRPLTEEGPQPRPSQAGPPPDPPRPAFERTPWSSLPVEDVDAAPATSSSADRAGAPAVSDPAARARRSPSAQPATGDDSLDLGNFTARGGRVGRAEAKRRKRSR